MRIRRIIKERQMMIHPHIGIKTIQRRKGNEEEEEEKETFLRAFQMIKTTIGCVGNRCRIFIDKINRPRRIQPLEFITIDFKWFRWIN